MAKVVVDCSVAIKWFIEGPHSLDARRVLNDYESGDLDLLVPDLIYAEIGNVVWKKQCFHGMAESEAKEILQAFQTLSLAIVSSSLILNEAHHLAVAHVRTVYDSLYIALSLRDKCPLVTADLRLFNAVKTAFPNMVWVADYQAA